MRLSSLMHAIGARPSGGSLAAAHDPELSDLSDDSRQVRPGVLFVARSGAGDSADGGRFIPQAVDAGAAAVLAQPEALREHTDLLSKRGVPAWEHDRVNPSLAGAAAETFFDRPSHKLRLLGVTGTNGKSTTVSLVRYLLAVGGIKTGLLGTIEVDTGGPTGAQPAELTTPGPIETSRLLAEMVAHGCGAAAMEVSSHALDQGRCAALRFAGAGFSNLTQDHLDYHGTMEDYADAKAVLFSHIPEDAHAVVNGDDPWTPRLIAGCRAPVLRFALCDAGTTPEPGVLTAEVRALGIDGADVVWHGPEPGRRVEARLPLIGRFNVANATLALGLARAIGGLTDAAAAEALRHCPQTPGRVERVTHAEAEPGGAPTVFVDYAHTPDALENVGGALGPLAREKGRLITVFGCGGDRDRAKRPLMLGAARRHADEVWLTSDNPRTEDPQQILRDAQKGAEPAGPIVRVEVDRASAIRQAIHGAAPGDTVLIAGKGHEDYQVLADGQGGTLKIHFDDREQAAEALASRPG
ncbi:MAG: UDP-N-acetylmuramoyl-L-alanyl-D-glutamate--2,6-diaminopimelate ligase [Planctomycetota bacterium]